MGLVIGLISRVRVLSMAFLVLGLSACGGDDEPVTFEVTIANISAPGSLVAADGSDATDVIFTPGAWAVYDGTDGLVYAPGVAASRELSLLAEDGTNLPLAGALENDERVVGNGTFGMPGTGMTYEENPIAPGGSVSFEVVARPGQTLSFVSMFAQSNDLFVGPAGGGVTLGTGDTIVDVRLWDAGTEVNEEPGFGPTQAPRQPEPGAGVDEDGVVTEIAGTDTAGFTYAPADTLIEARITSR